MNSDYKNYVLNSLLWKSLITALKPTKSYSFHIIRVIRDSNEGSCYKASREALWLMKMPGPLSEYESELIHIAPWQQEILDQTKEKIKANSSFLTPRTTRRLQLGQLEEYSPRYPVVPNINFTTDLIRNIEMPEIKEVKQDKSGIDWSDVEYSSEKRSRERYQKKMIDREFKNIYASFGDELELMYHIDAAADFFYQQTKIDRFHVIIQRRSSWSKDVKIEACYYITDIFHDDNDKKLLE